MNIILYLWVVTAATGYPVYRTFTSWQVAGTYASAAACHEAAHNLNQQHRCIDARTGAVR